MPLLRSVLRGSHNRWRRHPRYEDQRCPKANRFGDAANGALQQYDYVQHTVWFSGRDADQAVAAAKSAHAHEFIETLPDGYETRVGHGGHRLSGGQRQRISLARALLRNPEFLILDECTSQIDMHSERLIRQSLREHRGKRTMIIITHREALLELADVVYEVNHGKFVEINLSELESRAA